MDEKLPSVYNDVVIIGAGLSGVNMACQLQRQLGITDFVIYDRAQELGGAWAANNYPGCGVDIPGALYSLSWFPNPSFTKVFPSQPEILSYIQRVAAAYRVDQHVHLLTEWTGAKWMEERAVWHIYLRDMKTKIDYVHEAKILISAVGGYTNPKFPSLPGAENFEGDIVHTAQWGKNYDLRGRKVAVIGNGCSASQVVPAIVDDVGSLIQFIRQPQHYVPMPFLNHECGWLLKTLFAWLPALLMLLRWAIFLFLDSALTQFYDDADGPEMRKKSLQRSRDYVMEKAPACYWPLLTPGYDLGCRRRILDNNYIQSLHRTNVRLVQDSVALVGPKGLTTASGAHHEVDFIILATGFQFSQWQGDKVFGRNGVSLNKHWEQSGGIEAYKTVALNEFPNFFYLLGPNSGSGHNSVLFSIECASDLVIKITRPILRRQCRSVEVVQDAETLWYTDVQEALRKTVLTKSCSNQYADPKTGWNFFSYPFSSFRLWKEARFPDMTHWAYK